MRATLTTAILAALAAPSAAFAVEIDGRIDPAEWQGAQHITDFRLTQPLSRAPAPQPTEAWILATDKGLAIGFRNLSLVALAAYVLAFLLGRKGGQAETAQEPNALSIT